MAIISQLLADQLVGPLLSLGIFAGVGSNTGNDERHIGGNTD